jgi:hypothetical protein
MKGGLSILLLTMFGYEQTQGCISIDTRRPAGDTVTLFSCGGRADGGKSMSRSVGCLPLS